MDDRERESRPESSDARDSESGSPASPQGSTVQLASLQPYSQRGEPLSALSPRPDDSEWPGIADERLVVELLLSQAPIIVWEIDSKGIFTFSRGQGLSELNLEPDQVVGTSAFDRYRDNPDIIAHLNSALQGACVDSPSQVKGRHFRTRYTPVRDADGSVRSVVGVTTVVTGQRRAEQDRDQNRRRLEAISNAVPVGLFVCDNIGACVEANEKLCQLAGITQEQMLGDGWLRCIHESHRDRVARLWQKAMNGDGFFRDEQLLQRPDGSTIWVAVNSVPEHDADGNVLYYVGAVTDITDYKDAMAKGQSILQEQIRNRKEAARELMEMDGRYQAVLENAPDYILEIMLDGTIRSINRTIPPLTKSEVEGKSIYDFVAPEYHEREKQRYRRIMETHRPSQWETEAKDPDGRDAIYLSRAAPVIRGDEVTSFIVISTDITDQRRAEQEAEQRRDEVSHLSRIAAMSSMAATLVHELTKPLSNIAFQVGPVIRNNDEILGDVNKVREIFTSIHEQVARSEKMIARLRGFANTKTLERENCSPATLMEEANLQAMPFTRKSGTKVRIEIDPDLPDVHADLILIEQVLVNLMQNAVDAMDAVPADERSIHATVRLNAEGFVEFAIRDSGPGLPENFDFHEFKAFNTTKSHGMGIGLSNSQETVRKHGGQLWAEAAEGQERGATFRLTLPVSQECDPHEL